jgi:hypothetical protein
MWKKDYGTNLLLVSLAVILLLLIAVHLPPQQTVFRSEISNPKIGTYELNIHIPNSVWFGKKEKMTLLFEQTQSLDSSSNEPISKIKNFEVDFILTGGTLFPPGILETPIVSDQNINLEWEIMAEEVSVIPGSVRIFIITSSDQTNQEQERELLYARDFSILVLNPIQARFVWIQAILFSIFLILIFILIWIKFPKNDKNKINLLL